MFELEQGKGTWIGMSTARQHCLTAAHNQRLPPDSTFHLLLHFLIVIITRIIITNVGSIVGHFKYSNEDCNHFLTRILIKQVDGYRVMILTMVRRMMARSNTGLFSRYIIISIRVIIVTVNIIISAAIAIVVVRIITVDITNTVTCIIVLFAVF